jgi:hypothetical protein
VKLAKNLIRAITRQQIMNLREFYKMAIPVDSTEVEIDEVVIRPTARDF